MDVIQGDSRDADTNSEGKESTEAAIKKRRALYLGQAREMLSSFGDRLSDSRWKDVAYARDKHITCYELEAGPEEGYNLKAECIIEGKTADLIAQAHRNHQVISRKAWDGDDIHDIGLLERVREQDISGTVRMEVNVQFAEHKPVVPLVAIREFVYIEASLREASTANPDDHKWTILTRETTHPKKPAREDPVRALSRTIMILLPLTPKEDDGMSIPRTAVTLVAWAHPGGYITPGVIKLYKTKIADRLAFLKTTMFV